MSPLVLFTSKNIFIENENEEFSFVDGGILVNDGKIERIFYDQKEINSFLYNQPIVSKVCQFFY